MRKIFKKAVAAVAVAAMMIGSVVAMPTEAKAADGVDNGSYYVIGSMNGWSTTTPSEMTKNGTVYTYTWDVTAAGGQPIPTGVYLYRAKISAAGGSEQTKTRKIVILDNK